MLDLFCHSFSPEGDLLFGLIQKVSKKIKAPRSGLPAYGFSEAVDRKFHCAQATSHASASRSGRPLQFPVLVPPKTLAGPKPLA